MEKIMGYNRWHLLSRIRPLSGGVYNSRSVMMTLVTSADMKWCSAYSAAALLLKPVILAGLGSVGGLGV